MSRHSGAYFCRDLDNYGQNTTEDVIENNGTGCRTDEFVPNPKYDPNLRYGDPGWETPNIRVELETPICPPEFGTPAQMPGLWCQWTPGGDRFYRTQELTDEEVAEAGGFIAWDGGEKFYDAAEWLEYIVNNFLKPGAFMTTEKGRELVRLSGDHRLQHFTCDHTLNGQIDAQGEESDDRWRIVVKDSVVDVQYPTVVWPE
jgi:hypothetical protein